MGKFTELNIGSTYEKISQFSNFSAGVFSGLLLKRFIKSINNLFSELHSYKIRVCAHVKMNFRHFVFFLIFLIVEIINIAYNIEKKINYK